MTKNDLKVWSRHIHLQKMDPSLSNLLPWMEEELTARLRSSAAIRKNGSPRTNSHVLASINRQEMARAKGQPDDNREKQSQCCVCRGAHYVDLCSRFLAMTPQERWKVVKEQRGCFSCLRRSKGHSSVSCLRKEACTEKRRDGSFCGKFHHKLLHGALDNGMERSENMQVSSIQDSGKAILPIVSGLIKGNDTETVEASVFYDSGAQVSIIRSALAERLRLERKPIEIVITKVGGVEEDLDTKLYKVPVCNENGKLVQTIRAVGIPQISDETANPNVN